MFSSNVETIRKVSLPTHTIIIHHLNELKLLALSRSGTNLWLISKIMQSIETIDKYFLRFNRILLNFTTKKYSFGLFC